MPARRNNFTKEEAKKILGEAFKIWPKPIEGVEYGPKGPQVDAYNVPHKHPVDVCLMYGGGRAGKCFKIDTPIMLFDGTIEKVQNLKVGQLLMGPDSNPRVIENTCQGTEQMYTIKPIKDGFDEFVCNESHILALMTAYNLAEIHKPTGNVRRTRYGGQKFIKVAVKEYLTWSDRKKATYKLYKPFNPIKFPKNDNHLLLDPYFLGIWLGDGNSSGPAITTVDPEIESYLHEFCATHPEYRVSSHKESIRYDLVASNKSMKPKDRSKLPSIMRSLNLINNKHIPHVYKTASIEDRLQLLAGLLDTDGTLGRKPDFSITQKRKDLAEDILFVARSLGFYSSIHKRRSFCTYKGDKRYGTYYVVSIYGDLAKIPTRIARKKAASGKRNIDHIVSGFSVEKYEETDTYYGFSLEGEGEQRLFLLGDFTVAHNTKLAVAIGAEYMLSQPNTDIMVGCEKYNHLERTTMNDYKKLFTIKTPWDHPLVSRAPTKQHKILELINGSRCFFMHFTDFEVLRGAELACAHIDEASLLKDKSVMGECSRRLSNTSHKTLRIIITSNPEEVKGWLHETFSLEQFEPTYSGPPIPIGKPCNCQFCQICINKKDSEEVLYEDNICPKCGDINTTGCPGNQRFWRVVFCDPRDNPNLPKVYRQTQKASTTDIEFQLYTEGQVVELHQTKPYKSFDRRGNVFPIDIPLDPTKPMYWSHDFNVKRQCSVVCQEEEIGGVIYSNVIDQIVMPSSRWTKKPTAGSDDVAIEWLTRYYDYDGIVYLIFDPSAFNNSGVYADDKGVRISLMKERLEDPERFRFAESDIKKEHPLFPACKPKKVISLTEAIQNKTKVYVDARVNSVNALLETAGVRRLRINPSLDWLIRSLESVKWAEGTGRPALDIQIDKADFKNPDKVTVRAVTHITDALGYYVYKRFPAAKLPYSENFAFIPGVGSVQMNPDGNISSNSPNREKPKISDPLNITPTAEEKKPPPQPSILKLLEAQGAFEDFDNDPIKSFFGF